MFGPVLAAGPVVAADDWIWASAWRIRCACLRAGPSRRPQPQLLRGPPSPPPALVGGFGRSLHPSPDDGRGRRAFFRRPFCRCSGSRARRTAGSSTRSLSGTASSNRSSRPPRRRCCPARRGCRPASRDRRDRSPSGLRLAPTRPPTFGTGGGPASRAPRQPGPHARPGTGETRGPIVRSVAVATPSAAVCGVSPRAPARSPHRHPGPRIGSARASPWALYSAVPALAPGRAAPSYDQGSSATTRSSTTSYRPS